MRHKRRRQQSCSHWLLWGRNSSSRHPHYNWLFNILFAQIHQFITTLITLYLLKTAPRHGLKTVPIHFCVTFFSYFWVDIVMIQNDSLLSEIFNSIFFHRKIKGSQFFIYNWLNFTWCARKYLEYFELLFLYGPKMV